MEERGWLGLSSRTGRASAQTKADCKDQRSTIYLKKSADVHFTAAFWFHNT